MKFVFIYIIQQAEPFWNHYIKVAFSIMGALAILATK